MNTSTYFEKFREGRYSLWIFVSLITYLWWPSLWNGQLRIDGDAAHHGLSLLAFLKEGLSGNRNLLWESGIYGGHPLFAESQGGFVNPVNILCALLFKPEYGIGVLHWLNMLLGGTGVYVLCRTLHLSRWSAAFACITVSYSSIWLSFQYNISVTGSMAWLPWLLAAAEHWLNHPTLQRASLLAIPAALMIFGGYPHFAYSAAIYLVCYGFCLLIKTDGRAFLQKNSRNLLWGGLLATVLAVGLASIQLLPLAELVTHSHRKTGITIQFGGLVPTLSYLRGLLYFDAWIPDPLTVFGNLASISACTLACLLIFRHSSTRILAHGVAALLMLNLGMEFASPLFQFIYKHNLLPGLHSFRIMHPFFVLVVIGIAVVAAYILDSIAERPIAFAKLILFLALCAAVVWSAYAEPLHVGNFIAPLIIVTATLTLGQHKTRYWIPLIATCAISLDALFLRTHIFNFYDTDAFPQPKTIEKILSDQDIASYRTADHVFPLKATFMLPNNPGQLEAYRQVLESLSPFPTLRWGIPSMNGVLALQLAPRGLINNDLLQEISGQSPTPPGYRLIDIFGVKYISYGSPLNTSGFELLSDNPNDGVLVYQNIFALPKIRTYAQALRVRSADKALKLIRAGEGKHLLIEGRPKADQTCRDDYSAQLSPKLISSTRYLIDTNSTCSAWLFVADAYYPGWSARINGQPAKLYPAQILGKAVQIPPGTSTVEIRFTPWSFYLGATISLLSTIALLVVYTRKTHE